MSSLRRDLIERRLWPLAVVLIAAIVAVPFLLAGHSHRSKAALADSAAPVPASAQTTSTSSSTATTGPAIRRATASSSTRDPFAGGTSTSTSTTSAGSSAGGGGSSSAGSTQTQTQSSAVASVGAAGNTPSSSGAASSGAGATGSPTTTVTTTTTAPSTTTTSKTSDQTERSVVYYADVRFQAPGRRESISAIARFTPLPAATWPRVMFMGITTGGRGAVFQLGAGVSATGKATCHPSHDSCTVISLPAGRSERLSWIFGGDQRRTMQLSLTRITKHVITDRNEALAAINRHSQIGLCELQIGDPLQYQYRSSGQLKSVTNAEPACTRAMRKVALAFPGTAKEYGEIAFPAAMAPNGQLALTGPSSEDGQ